MISRRRFIGSAAAVVGSASLAPLVRASNKSGLDPVIVGSGDHTYRCVHNWGTLPNDIAWGNTHGVCVDSAGNVFIKHTVHATSTKADAVVVFDSKGTFVRSFGPQYKGGAHGLHLSREDGHEYLYLCDQARGVVDKTTLTGELVWSQKCPMESGLYADPGEYHPTNVAVHAPKGQPGVVFIGDGYGKSWIHRYSLDGAYLGSFGGPGKERGQVSCPHGLMVDQRQPEPRLIVADRSNNRIQYFTLDGRPRGTVRDVIKMPCHFDQHGKVLLVPDLLARVTLLGADDSVLAQLGDDNDYRLRDQPRDKFVPGKFIAPHGACFDTSGNIFVVEWVEVGRVTRLERV